MSLAQINAIKAAVSDLLEAVNSRGAEVTAEEQNLLAHVLNQAADRLFELQDNLKKNPEPPPEAPIPESVDLLWILAGGNEEAFVSYLRTFPDPAFNAILRNPAHLRQIIANLSQRFPEGINLQADGIPHGPLMSSNIYGFRYDPKSGRLLVRFNSGSVYAYQGVPKGVFDIFASGAVPAKTSGQNRFGQWWQGKQPSAGAAFYEMIRLGGYPYTRIN